MEKQIYNLRGGFFIRPLAIGLGLGGLGAILPPIDAAWLTKEKSHSLVRLDHALVLSILSSIAEAVMTVISNI